jgi:hypothetical protein
MADPDHYVLDNAAAELVRLNRQAAALRPMTERLFRGGRGSAVPAAADAGVAGSADALGQ